MKLRQQINSTAINITIVKIAEIIYLTRHLLTNTNPSAGQLSQKGCGQTVCGAAWMDSYELLGNFVDISSSGIMNAH